MHERREVQKCDLCNKTYVNARVLRRHKKEVHAKQVSHKCDFCDKAFQRPALLKIHVDSVHSKSPNSFYQCNLCDRTFPGNTDLYYHNIHKHQARKYSRTCTECDISVDNWWALKQHIKLFHKDQTTLKCAPCKKGFKTKKAFLNHSKEFHWDFI